MAVSELTEAGGARIGLCAQSRDRNTDCGSLPWLAVKQPHPERKTNNTAEAGPARSPLTLRRSTKRFHRNPPEAPSVTTEAVPGAPPPSPLPWLLASSSRGSMMALLRLDGERTAALYMRGSDCTTTGMRCTWPPSLPPAPPCRLRGLDGGGATECRMCRYG
ncbi:hypothetical protein EYF80_043123 [Liparis tanakae]|uniref:Uncharacterized protein n=1 Tax=Liparis tanakae TaxID=230148 RepID=A0A4Z2G1D4_9TELE|nr:hypothetical protein EYF80_043123 [Liparis tanakae]